MIFRPGKQALAGSKRESVLTALRNLSSRLEWCMLKAESASIDSHWFAHVLIHIRNVLQCMHRLRIHTHTCSLLAIQGELEKTLKDLQAMRDSKMQLQVRLKKTNSKMQFQVRLKKCNFRWDSKLQPQVRLENATLGRSLRFCTCMLCVNLTCLRAKNQAAKWYNIYIYIHIYIYIYNYAAQ